MIITYHDIAEPWDTASHQNDASHECCHQYLMISNIAVRLRSIVCASCTPMMPLMSAIISSLQYLFFCKWRQLLIPEQSSMLISSCNKKHSQQCSCCIMMPPMSAIRITYMQICVWQQLFISNAKCIVAVRPRSIVCASRVPMMPLMSAIVSLLQYLFPKWRQLLIPDDI